MSYNVRAEIGEVTEADQRFMEHLRVWCLLKEHRVPSGAMVIPIYDDGVSLQYVGSEVIDLVELQERLLDVAAIVAENPYTPPAPR
jgi:hypothetical protein